MMNYDTVQRTHGTSLSNTRSKKKKTKHPGKKNAVLEKLLSLIFIKPNSTLRVIEFSRMLIPNAIRWTIILE